VVARRFVPLWLQIDPWWNPAAEDQAIDRVHRIGQQRPVAVVRFVIEVRPPPPRTWLERRVPPR